ncbi:hypothetical protein BASA81_015690 [Batrachochytrium salamandrivorans]|nr:hypothetical protein BASA81_015690 [Batrachochytrium salamandrivorans]
MSTKKLTRRQARWSLELSDILLLSLTAQESLTEERIHFQDEKTISWTGDQTGEDNIWIEEISEDWLELCKKGVEELQISETTLSFGFE